MRGISQVPTGGHHTDFDVGLSGITVDLSEAYVGSRHDQAMPKDSQIETVLRRYAKGTNGRQMVLYGDKGYQLTDVIITPFPGVSGEIPDYQRRFNLSMSRIRIGVEHEFGRVRNVFRATQYEGEGGF